MVPYLGDFLEYSKVYIPLNTFDSNDPSASTTITNLVNTDVHIHKGESLVQRNDASGVTVSIDFDGITGNHFIVIDTSDDTIPNFFEIQNDYFVRIEGATVDAATINAWIAHFSIQNRYIGDSHDRINVNVEEIGEENVVLDPETGLLNVNLVELITKLDTLLTRIVGTINAGSHVAQSADHAAAIAAIPTNPMLDTEDGSSFSAIPDMATTTQLNTIAGYLDTEIAAILADTNELQTNQGNWLTATGFMPNTEDGTNLTNIILPAGGLDLITCDVATVGAAPGTLINKIQAIWNRLFTKRSATALLETAYEKNDLDVMETWDLSDDDTTATRSR